MDLFRTKSIEELQANAEQAEHKLVRTLLEDAVDAGELDEAALANACPLRPVPQQRPLMNLLGVASDTVREGLLAAMKPEEDSPRIASVERRRR